jgi:hypothetical protein
MRTLVIYAFHDFNDSLLFFIRHGLINSPHVFYLFVGNCDPLTLKMPSHKNIKIVFRDNTSFDFGAWSYGLFHVSDIKIDEFDYFVFVNQTVKGPFLPAWCKTPWFNILTDMLTDNTKLVGTTIGLYKGTPYVQSMLMATDEVGLNIAIKNGIFSPDIKNMEHMDVVVNKEVEYSKLIFQQGYNINCTMSLLHNFNFQKASLVDLWGIRNYDVNHEHSYIGVSLDPYDVIFIKSNRHIDEYKLDLYSKIVNRSNNYDICPAFFRELSKYNTEDNFDAEYYLKSNPDVVKEGFNTPERLKEHFVKYGKTEGRLGSAKCIDIVKSELKKLNIKKDLPLDFSWTSYISLNKDLELSGIDTEEKAIMHYKLYGKNEKRSYIIKAQNKLPDDFNWQQYIDLNKDLHDFGINTEEKAKNHYAIFGKQENRLYKKKAVPVV